MSTKKKSNTKSNTAKKVDAKAKTATAKPKAAPAAKAKKAEAKKPDPTPTVEKIEVKPVEPQPTKAAVKPAEKPEKKLSLVKAAVAVLSEDNAALTVKQIIAAAKEKGLWSPGAGKTPEQTLYSAILREMKTKGEASRFVKDAPGHFRIRD